MPRAPFRFGVDRTHVGKRVAHRNSNRMGRLIRFISAADGVRAVVQYDGDTGVIGDVVEPCDLRPLTGAKHQS